MDIPFVTFENMHKEIKEEAIEKFKKIYDKGWFIQGEEVEKFENELKSGQIPTILFLYLLNRL